MRTALVLAIGCVLGACGGGGASPKEGGAAKATCWPVVPLRVESIEHGTEWETVGVLEAGGRASHKSSTLGLLENDTFKMVQGGTMSCTSDLRIELNGNKTAMHHDETGALVEGSQKVFVAEDGRVTFGKNGPGAAVRVRVIGANDAATRRTAALLVFASTM